jgi:hypothetical protein
MGYAVGVNSAGVDTLEPQHSDVVCFESHADESDSQRHQAIMLNNSVEGAFPPNTLFRLRSVKEDRFIAPTGVEVRQRLLTVSATYRPSRQIGETWGKNGGPRLCGSVVTLLYESRAAFVKGMDDVLGRPMLTMAQECSRPDRFVDWRGVAHTLRAEWEYVNGPAGNKHAPPGAGERDTNHEGMVPADFERRVNSLIRQRRADGHGLALREVDAMLSRDEVLAARLYSGPAFQPVNEFLRQLAHLHGALRTALARLPSVTFVATVGHLCRAIRKLAAVATPSEVEAPLYRGVRGELPKGFWLPDDQGLVCATDTAFMSTSRNRQTPVGFMTEGGPNLLWQLQPKKESDAAFHRGADISTLSQFSEEEEVLFPPYTMLNVQQNGAKKRNGSLSGSLFKAKPQPGSVAQLTAGLQVAERTEGGRSFLAVNVEPSFV